MAGSVALDLNCDYAGGMTSGNSKAVSPELHTSNPATISQSIGGVGHNIALAAHRVSEEGRVRLCSMVGDDIAGSTILSALQASGLDPSYIRRLGHEYPSAQNDIGVLYQAGLGVPIDYKEAMKWYRLAADQNLPMAMVNIGNLYRTGLGVTKDDQEARRWFQRAADLGSTEAKAALMTLDGH